MNCPITQTNKNKEERLDTGWPRQQQFKKSIKLEFALLFSVMFLILMIVTGYIITNYYVKTTTENVLEKLLIQSRSYSRSAGKLIIASAEPDKLLLNNICKNLTSDNADVYWTGIANNDNTFIAHTDIIKVITSKKLSSITSDDFNEVLHVNETLGIRGDTIFVTVPIVENEVILGKLAVSSSDNQISRARKTSIITVSVVTFIMIVLGIVFTMLILGRKLRSISIITNNLKQMDFDNLSFDYSINDKNELGYLSETLKAMGSKLIIAQQNLIENERMAKELEIAREIQAQILPREYPRSELFEVAGTYISAKEVGGDYYDFIDFDDEFLTIIIADVSGKSLPGMINMLITRDITKDFLRTIRQPAETLKHVNHELLSNLKKGTFVTMFCGLLNKKTGQLTFASAGHNPLIKVYDNNSKVELIKTNGYPLGLMPSHQFEKRIETGQIALEKNDLLIQYTDGINEALNSAGEEFGMNRFLELIKSLPKNDFKKFVDEIIHQHEAFVGQAHQYDDITLIAIKWHDKSAEINIIRQMEAAGDKL